MISHHQNNKKKFCLNDIETLRDDEALCIDRVQSFRDCTDFNNLNAHVTSNLHADKKVK